jgi:hypothetical protein
MRSNRPLFVIMALVAMAISGSHTSRASIIWDESVNGDLSGDRLNPNHFILAQGTSTVIATSNTGDREYVNFTVPAGLTFSALNHITWQSVDEIGFMAIQTGTTFTEPPTGTNVANLLGYSHFGPGAGTVGLDMLPFLATGPGAMGFTPPLPSGDYTFWIQQTGANLATYTLDFVVTPEPSSAALVGLLALAGVRRRGARGRR